MISIDLACLISIIYFLIIVFYKRSIFFIERRYSWSLSAKLIYFSVLCCPPMTSAFSMRHARKTRAAAVLAPSGLPRLVWAAPQ